MNELYFMSMANLGVDEWDEYNGKCFSFENKTDTFCKEDFGFMGIKQWIDTKDYELINNIFDNDNKTVTSVFGIN